MLILAEAEFDIRGVDYIYHYNRQLPDDWGYYDTKKVKELVFCDFNSWEGTSPEFFIRKTYTGEAISLFDIQKTSGYEPYTMEKLDKMKEIDPPIKKVKVRAYGFDPLDGEYYFNTWVEEKEKIEHKELFERFAEEYGFEIVSRTHTNIIFKRPGKDKTKNATYNQIKEFMDEKNKNQKMQKGKNNEKTNKGTHN